MVASRRKLSLNDIDKFLCIFVLVVVILVEVALGTYGVEDMIYAIIPTGLLCLALIGSFFKNVN